MPRPENDKRELKDNFEYDRQEGNFYAGVMENDFSKAEVAILPVPYSSTTYYNPNTREGPKALIEASRHMELWDEELEKDISREVGIYTMDALSPSKNSPKEVVEQIAQIVGKIMDVKKFPLILGGEHSITSGPVKAIAERVKNLSILQIDAHTDLRDEFEGTKYHHGTVMRRIIEDLGVPVTQVGIRSISEECAEFIKTTNKRDLFYAKDILKMLNLPLDEIISTLNENVYITFDLDALDPSIMPSTGTPEPGGFSWYQALEILRRVTRERKIVGADIVELSPIPGISHPDFLAAKLAYKLIGYTFLQR